MDTHQPSSTQKKNIDKGVPAFRGFTLQLFLLIILPLTILVLLIAFGSQSLHHEAMRSLVGDRDLRTVQAAASSLDRELSHICGTIQILSRNLEGKTDFSSILLTPEELSSTFDGGLALYTKEGSLIYLSSTKVDWINIPNQFSGSFAAGEKVDLPRFSRLITSDKDSIPYMFVSVLSAQNNVLIGAFTPDRMIKESIGNLPDSGQITVLVISPSETTAKFDILYHTGPLNMDEIVSSHPGIQEVLTGESGINYFQSSKGEHVVAFSPIQTEGWGIIIEEAWEDISNPYLVSTQAAPLILVPVILLALLAIWFGASRIVTPLQKLEKQATYLASGDFDAVNQPVGGIEEIRNLQSELIEMAEKLKTAQQTLHEYIGAITEGIENERKNLARELHDDTIQALIVLNQRIQMTLLNTPKLQSGPLNDLQSLVQQSMTNLRRLIRGLRPIYLEDLGLVASLEMLVREMEQSSNLPIKLTTTGQEHRLGSQSELFIYRMVQESLNNVIQHAKASQAWVNLEYVNDRLLITIHDDGIGFEVPSNRTELPQKGHFGLLGLSERADLIHAELEINSKPGEGTTILIKTSETKYY